MILSDERIAIKGHSACTYFYSDKINVKNIIVFLKKSRFKLVTICSPLKNVLNNIILVFQEYFRYDSVPWV